MCLPACRVRCKRRRCAGFIGGERAAVDGVPIDATHYPLLAGPYLASQGPGGWSFTFGGDRVQLMSNFIYKRAISLLDWPLAAVGAWVLLVTALLIIVVYLRLFGRQRWEMA